LHAPVAFEALLASHGAIECLLNDLFQKVLIMVKLYGVAFRMSSCLLDTWLSHKKYTLLLHILPHQLIYFGNIEAVSRPSSVRCDCEEPYENS
jgi:hypothetical protein